MGQNSVIIHCFAMLVFVTLPIFYPTTSSAAAAAGISGKSNETDLQALLQFKSKITKDPFGVLSSWNSSIHFCQWQGVRCGRRHQRVTVLNLMSLKFAGTLSPYIGNLSFLRVLDLEDNTLSREIPREIAQLHRLEILYLNNNTISGEIPSNLSNLFNLVKLDLSQNQLVGSIPPVLGSLSNLQIVLLQNNNLTETIPHSLGNLSHLVALDLGQNLLTGSIPDSFGQLANLLFLGLFSNKLSGNIPASIFNLSSIDTIEFGVNDLSGNLVQGSFISFQRITWLALSFNRFTGSIPSSLSNLSSLVNLQLQRNQFTGGVPSLHKVQKLQLFNIKSNNLGNGEANDLNFLTSLTNATMLDGLYIGDNLFGGVLPEQIGNFSATLRTFVLGANQLQGSIPLSITNFINLEIFFADQNQLSGIIPYNIGNLQNLKLLSLNTNMLFGNIPPSLGNISGMMHLSIGGNDLRGSIPSSLGKCQNMLLMDLSRNNLTGPIPPQVIGIPSLAVALGLSGNHLSGVLPMEVGNMRNLGYLDLSRNKLSGVVPSTLSKCMSLESLSLGHNFFEGYIPSSLSSLKGLEFLNLSHNRFSGEIPEFLSHLKALRYLNLSFNNLEGSLPTSGIFENASATSVAGNNKLCGGIPEFKLPMCRSPNRPHKKGLGKTLKLVIGIVSLTLGLLVAVLSVIFCFWLRLRRRTPILNNQVITMMKLSYQNLYTATEGFSASNVIGKGSFGSVYKGALDSEGSSVAIKVLNLVHRGALKSFIAECETLKNIRHRNLVKVLTVCSSIDHQGNDFKALVYEFMVNGSLEEWLHHQPIRTNDQSVEAAQRKLNLLQRLSIAIDVACALDYLHHQNETPIVHCDLKPSNILLNDEMTAHVGDFGLAKFLLEAPDDSNVNQSSSIGVRGTVGYAPPEYGMGNEVAICGDVYSYGILLLEMFTRRKPVDDVFNAGLNLHKFVQSFLPLQVLEILDPVLLQELELQDQTNSTNLDRNQRSVRNSIGRVQELVVSVFKIGVACSIETPGERMRMDKVAAQLISIRGKLLETGGRRAVVRT